MYCRLARFPERGGLPGREGLENLWSVPFTFTVGDQDELIKSALWLRVASMAW